jgi:outer membrane protein assembly factor BamB
MVFSLLSCSLLAASGIDSGSVPSLAWNVSFGRGGDIHSPVALSEDETLLFALTTNATLIALRSSNGEIAWSKALPCGAQYCSAGQSGPVVFEGSVLAAIWSDEPAQISVFKLDGGTGNIIWKNNVSKGGHVSGQILIVPQAQLAATNHSNLVVIPTYTAGLLALDGDTGAQTWQFLPTQGSPMSPTLAEGIIYVPFNGVAATISAINASDASMIGTLFSQSPAGIGDGGIAVSPSGKQLVFGWDWTGGR